LEHVNVNKNKTLLEIYDEYEILKDEIKNLTIEFNLQYELTHYTPFNPS
jgi:hypothetical protein